MDKNRILTHVLFIALCLTPLALYAEEELFNTGEAARRIEEGIVHLQAKDFDAAIREFEKSAAIYPDAEAYYYLGYAYYLKARTMDGENRRLSRENFERAYELDPNFTPTRFKPAEQAPPTEQPRPETPAPEDTPQYLPSAPVMEP
jgi:tetratricopeptide (TPR) repeat protein